MCARALLWASCFPLLSTPGRTSEAFSSVSWRVLLFFFLKRRKVWQMWCIGQLLFQLPLLLGVLSPPSFSCQHCGASPAEGTQDPLLQGQALTQGVPSSECLAFSPHLGGNSEGHCGSWSPCRDGTASWLLLSNLPPSLFPRCSSRGHSFRNICKLIAKVEPLLGKPSLWQKTIRYLWIADWIMLFSCLKCLWDKVQTP